MRKCGKLITTALAAAMIFQSTAMAAPMDELNEILTSQATLQQETLLAQTLGLAELEEAIKQNGIDFSVKGGLAEGTAEALMMEDEIPENAYAELGFSVDLNAKNWLLEAGFGAEGASMGDLALYGDSEKLSLSIPQLFVGAVSLYAGNLKEQYAGSALEMMIGEGTSESVPGLNVRFYPEASDLEMLKGFAGSFEDALLQELQGIESEIRVEKKGNSEEMVYTLTCPMEVVKDVYSSFFEGYLSIISQTGLVEAYEIYEAEDDLDVILDTTFAVMPEELEMDFYTKDNMLEKIYYELYLDTSVLAQLEQMDEEISYNTQSSDEAETVLTEVVEGVLDEAGVVSDMQVEQSDEFKGTITYEIIYNDPSNPASSMDIHMEMVDEEKGEFADFLMQMATVADGSVSTTTLDMDISVQGTSVYSGNLYTQTFDAVTGDLDLVFGFDAESMAALDGDPEEMPEMRIDSTFTEIEAGKAFTWVLDGLTMAVDGESIGVTAEVNVSGVPETIAVPKQERVLLELEEDELTGLIMEVMMNAESWMAQFEPETEEVYDSDVYDDMEDEYEDEYKEAGTAAADATAVIGGADGPTSVFVAGKVS